ncbi:hypothetical protein SteCoe_13085 [Stentor coeruleus]|uniref:Uncharacterized protein n=1 Tax=Stentor coeruleus TaxID=5963 RepID=A0A1R2C971_9CILI|nr:hypothetical protein SteCoe_13085 [Stentor coeruleus]
MSKEKLSSLESIEELQDRCQNLEREGKYDVAQTLKNEIEMKFQLRKAEKLEELKNKQENDRIDLENNQLQEFNEFTASWEKRFENHKSNADEQIEKLIEKQKQEQVENLLRLESSIPQIFKKSSELLNMIQIKNGLLKMKEYGEAHKVQQRIDMLTEIETKNWEVERKKKIAQKMLHSENKHEVDLNALKKRLNAVEDEMKKKRSLEMEKLLQKFQNMKKERQNLQIQEVYKLLHSNS